MQPKHLDGKGLRHAIVAGADWVRHTREHINRINVFPVADGDTGNNMALSLGAIARALRHHDEAHVGKVAGIAAEASVLGAKGNSGLILAHWFLGFAEAVGHRAQLSASEMARAIHAAADAVYRAIERPVEGTILTVMRAAGDGAQGAAAAANDDLHRLADATLSAAEEALARTPEMLDVLRQSKVVDAGAQGFVTFLSGMHHSLRGDPLPQFEEEDVHELAAHPTAANDSHERFCTEVVVRGKHFDATRLRSRFSPLGSSMLLATSGEIFKLHIHTDHPDEVLRQAAKLGAIEERKVDDMRRQREERDHKSIQPLVPLELQPARVAIVCDSAGDLPKELRTRHAIESVPMQVLFGDEVYRDGVDLDGEELYRRMLEPGPHPTTSQPAPGAFLESLARVRADRPTILVTVSSHLSGTHRAASSAAPLAHQSQLQVYDSELAGVAQGMLALCAARLSERGASLEEITQWMDRWRGDVCGGFTISTLEYLKRGGRIGLAKGLVASLIGILPVFQLERGTLGVLGQERGPERCLRRILNHFDECLPAGAPLRVGLTYSTEHEHPAAIRRHLERDHEIVQLLEVPLAAAIGVHLGPGAYGAFAMPLRDDDPLAG